MRVRVKESETEGEHLTAQSVVPATKSALRGSQSAAPASSQSAAPATKRATCHEIRVPRRSPPCPKCCTCHEICISKYNRSDPSRPSRKVDFAPPKHKVPLRLPRKVITMSENVHGATTRAQSREAPAVDTLILRACAVNMHVDDFERHECE